MAESFQISDLEHPRSTALVAWIVAKVDSWETQRDTEYEARWKEYYRIWRGVWAAEDKQRESERSHAIMPDTAQAVESAVSEITEATFGRERWFDALNDSDQEAADRLLVDLESAKDAIAETFHLGALYGTGISKLVVGDDGELTVVAVEPRAFAIDPIATHIEEAMGVAHIIYLPKHIVEDRMADGTYNNVDIESAALDTESLNLNVEETLPYDTSAVRIVEWHGRVPEGLLDEGFDEETPLVEAIITIGNDVEILREARNPFKTRAFVAYQHDIVPRRFWGRGIPEKAYWPQKTLDSEVRARTDALAFSTHPMMAINSAAMTRRDDFTVRPGRNIFLNGAVQDNIAPISFPAPDPQTYIQAEAMGRAIEMATGQLQSPTKDIDTRNAAASGISLLMSAGIKRSKHTLARIERNYLTPLIERAYERQEKLVPRYPKAPGGLQAVGTLGITAKEMEISQLSQIMTGLPQSGSKLALLRLIVENSALTDKQDLISLINLEVANALIPPEPEQPSLSDQARLMSAQVRAAEAQHQAQMAEVKAQNEQQVLMVEREKSQLLHERMMVENSIKADEVEAKVENMRADSIKKIAEAEAEEVGTQIAEYQAVVASLADLQHQVDLLALPAPEGAAQPEAEREDEDIDVERDPETGLILSVGGQKVERDENNLIRGLTNG